MTTITVASKPISRREFLYYVWGASGALALTGACGLSAWYLLPDHQLTPQNGYFQIPVDNLPLVNQAPVLYTQSGISGPGSNSAFWLSAQPTDLIALRALCTKDQFLFKWVDLNNRFECPACGSKFQGDGSYISGPARRSLDRYTVYVTTPTERRETPPDGSSVRIDDATEIIVYTRRIIKGAIHANR